MEKGRAQRGLFYSVIEVRSPSGSGRLGDYQSRGWRSASESSNPDVIDARPGGIETDLGIQITIAIVITGPVSARVVDDQSGVRVGDRTKHQRIFARSVTHTEI